MEKIENNEKREEDEEYGKFKEEKGPSPNSP